MYNGGMRGYNFFNTIFKEIKDEEKNCDRSFDSRRWHGAVRRGRFPIILRGNGERQKDRSYGTV
jgi:hypothetical protein